MKILKYLTSPPRGLTLIEIIAVIGVAAILMAIAIPNFNSVFPGLRLTQAARQVATDLQNARMRAIAQNAATTVTFDQSAGTYTFGGDAFDIDQLYPGITISSVSANPVFTSRGTANGTYNITLSNGSTTRQVQVTPVGRVKIQ
jgi:prepilin-type N-terminal cleavage/methylation domain-containing protein